MLSVVTASSLPGAGFRCRRCAGDVGGDSVGGVSCKNEDDELEDAELDDDEQLDELAEDDSADSKAIDELCSTEDSIAFTAGFRAALVATFGGCGLGSGGLGCGCLG